MGFGGGDGRSKGGGQCSGNGEGEERECVGEMGRRENGKGEGEERGWKVFFKNIYLIKGKNGNPLKHNGTSMIWVSEFVFTKYKGTICISKKKFWAPFGKALTTRAAIETFLNLYRG